MSDDLVPIRISVKSMMQLFHPCEYDFIQNVCHGRCCEGPSYPQGTMISIHRSQADAIRARGGDIGPDGVLVTPNRLCTFKTEDHLCSLHHTPDKPIGCIVSPFTLNDHDCLIVRNRYRRLPCFKAEGAFPAYIAHRWSLDRTLGEAEADLVCRAMLGAEKYPDGANFIHSRMPRLVYDVIHEKNAVGRR